MWLNYMYCLYWSIKVPIKYRIGSDGGNTWIFHLFGDIYALLQLKDCWYSSSDRCFLRVTYLNCCCTLSGNPHTTAAAGFWKGWRAKWRCLLASALPWPWLSHSQRAPQSPSHGLCLINKTLFNQSFLTCLSAQHHSHWHSVLPVPPVSERGSA